jgi:hypothetical protein
MRVAVLMLCMMCAGAGPATRPNELAALLAAMVQPSCARSSCWWDEVTRRGVENSGIAIMAGSWGGRIGMTTCDAERSH